MAKKEKEEDKGGSLELQIDIASGLTEEFQS